MLRIAFFVCFGVTCQGLLGTGIAGPGAGAGPFEEQSLFWPHSASGSGLLLPAKEVLLFDSCSVFRFTATGSCPRLTPPPNPAPDALLSLPPHGLWSRHILQQTLMDEGLRLARLVSHERVGRLSPCLPGKPQGSGELPLSFLDFKLSLMGSPDSHGRLRAQS